MINKQYKIVVYFFFFFISTNKSYATKPQVNKNTKIRIEYGCKRPQWSKQTKTITIKYKNIQGITINDYKPDDELILEECIFSTRHSVLFNASATEPQIEVKKCKHNKQEAICCKVLSGQWKIFDGEKNTIITDPKQIQIDHILPFSYIRLNMKDCRLTNKYYNYLPNLRPELANINLKKSNNLCTTNQECEEQKQICKAMAQQFDDEPLCEELNKITL